MGEAVFCSISEHLPVSSSQPLNSKSTHRRSGFSLRRRNPGIICIYNFQRDKLVEKITNEHIYMKPIRNRVMGERDEVREGGER